MIIISTDMEFNLPVRYEMCASSAHVVHHFSHILAFSEFVYSVLVSTSVDCLEFGFCAVGGLLTYYASLFVKQKCQF